MPSGDIREPPSITRRHGRSSHMSNRSFTRTASLTALAALMWTTSAHAAWMWDTNSNKVDDRIEQVEAQGPLAARVGGVATGKLGFALMSTSAPYVYGVYVGYDHHPTDADAAALVATGAPVQVRYHSIDYIRSQV